MHFPEPDLPKLKISEIKEFKEEELRKEIPELPREKRARYEKIGKSKDENIESVYIEKFVSEPAYGDLFDETYKLEPKGAKLISNYIGSDLSGLVSKYGDKNLKNVGPKSLASLIGMVLGNKISSRGAKDILIFMFESGRDAEQIAKEKNLFQVSDEKELEVVVQKIIDSNPKIVEEYKKGKATSLEFLIGQGMKESKGKANPKTLRDLFVLKLG